VDAAAQGSAGRRLVAQAARGGQGAPRRCNGPGGHLRLERNAAWRADEDAVAYTWARKHATKFAQQWRGKRQRTTIHHPTKAGESS